MFSFALHPCCCLNLCLFLFPYPRGDGDTGLSHAVLRWLERDMSTNLCVTRKPFSPWPFRITSARCWRRTWNVTSTRRTRCLCLTLTKAWPTCQKGAAATPTPTTKATCTETSDSQAEHPALRLFCFSRSRESPNSLQSLFYFCCLYFIFKIIIQKGAFPVALFYGLPWTAHFIWGRVGVI